MAKQTTVSRSQLHQFQALQALDFVQGESKSKFEKVELKDIKDTLNYLGARYALELQQALKEADASSSGRLADSIVPQEVEVNGTVYTVSVEALAYADFIADGVDGWGEPSKGGKFKFKKPQPRNKGSKSTGRESQMVKSVKEWLSREKSFAARGFKPTTSRERKQAAITDTETRAAIAVAYMIKRMGIKPTHFIEKATDRVQQYVSEELGQALKVDIVNNLMK